MSDVDRRLGRFSIGRCLFEDDLSLVKDILKGCAIVEARHDFSTDAFEYMAVHDDFVIVPRGNSAPRYDWMIEHERHQTEMGAHITAKFKAWRKVSDGG